MKVKVLLIFIGIFLLGIFLGIYFAFDAIYNESSQEKEIDQILDKTEYKNKSSSHHSPIVSSNNSENDDKLIDRHKKTTTSIPKSNSPADKKQVIVDQVLHSKNLMEANKPESNNKKDKDIRNLKVNVEKTFEPNLKDLQKNYTSLDISILKKGGRVFEKGKLTILDQLAKPIFSAEVKNGKSFVKQILPGEYTLIYNSPGVSLQNNLEVLSQIKNTVEIYIPGSTLTVQVKNAEGAIITNVMITLYSGEKYRQENVFLGNKMVTPGDGKGTYHLMPKVPYCVVIEEDFRFNYQVNVIGPFVLEPGETKKIDYILPYARMLPKIQIVDTNGNPLPDVGFNFSDESGNFFQRTLKKEWDLYPYSNQDGFLPERGWPIGTFTLIVGKDGFEFREVVIPIDFNSNQLLQIKLQKASSITCNFSQTLPFPISVGVLNKLGDLIQKPIPVANHNKQELTVYFKNITSGSIKFNDLAAGEYYIGYFWNGSNQLISKQGPFPIGVEENLIVTSDLVK